MLHHIGVRLAMTALMLSSAFAQKLWIDEALKKTDEFRLANGMMFIVQERQGSKTVSFVTHADAGASREVPGIRGVSQILARLALKDPGLQRAYAEAGATGLRASSNADWSVVSVTLPSANASKWFELESARLANPVLSDFSKERDAFVAEQRARRDDDGLLILDLKALAYQKHPYRQPNTGVVADLEKLTEGDAAAYLKRYWAPANLTAVIAGNITRSEAKALAARYFGPLPGGAKAPKPGSEEPPQTAELRCEKEHAGQMRLRIGYRWPGASADSYAAWDLLAAIVEPRLQRRLVDESRIATLVRVYLGAPGMRYPALLTIAVDVAPGHTTAEAESELYRTIEQFKKDGAGIGELEQARRTFVHLERIETDARAAEELGDWQLIRGDWREYYRHSERIRRVHLDDIWNLAEAAFKPENRNVAASRPTAQDRRVMGSLTRMDTPSERFGNIEPVEGAYLRRLVRDNRATRIVELGTSTGYSSVWLAWPLLGREGRLITVEIDEGRDRQARENFRIAGLDRVIDAVRGDAIEEMKRLDGPLDFVFLDALKEDYIKYFELALPKMRSGGIIVAHNVTSHPDEVREFLKRIQNDPRLQTEIVTPGWQGFSVTRVK